MKIAISAALLSLTISVGTASRGLRLRRRQRRRRRLHPRRAAKMSTDDKKAVSKSCSDQANAKGLHGKARKKFRSDCKHTGGKA